MYSRILQPPSHKKSYFLFGPRGTGKTSFIRHHYGDTKRPIVIDEVQRVPALLNEVHRLIEGKKYTFILTGSSARKLRKAGVNQLAGRALRLEMFPLTSQEIQKDFNLREALKWGMLPGRFSEKDPKKFLMAYVSTYLKEEIQFERLTRNLSHFSRFLEAASFSQGQPIVITKVSQECHVERKTVEDFFSILEDLLISFRLPVFTKRAKREILLKDKFYFFDCGVFRAIRPKGPLDSESELDGLSLETLIIQEVRALNKNLDWNYELFHWRTKSKVEVDLILYGENGLHAIEIKNADRIRAEDLKGLELFGEDYPEAQRYFIYRGKRTETRDGIQCIPVEVFFEKMSSFFSSGR